MATTPIIMSIKEFTKLSEREGFTYIIDYDGKSNPKFNLSDIFTFYTYNEKDVEALRELPQPLAREFYDAAEGLHNYETNYICYTRAGEITKKEWDLCINRSRDSIRHPRDQVIIMGMTRVKYNFNEI